jgi:hypothetical protein
MNLVLDSGEAKVCHFHLKPGFEGTTMQDRYSGYDQDSTCTPQHMPVGKPVQALLVQPSSPTWLRLGGWLP